MDEGEAPKLDKDSAPQLLALVKGKELLGTPLQVRYVQMQVESAGQWSACCMRTERICQSKNDS